MVSVLRVDWHSIFAGCLELALLAGVLFYITRVLLAYFENKTHVRPRFDRRDPARSAERLAVWLGVKALSAVVRVLAPVFEMLSEASADVGDWFLNFRHPETH